MGRAKTIIAGFRERTRGLWTVTVGIIIALSGIALEVLDALSLVDLSALLPPGRAPVIIAALGVIQVALRVITRTPVGQRDGDAS
jgi:hypothetical protein